MEAQGLYRCILGHCICRIYIVHGRKQKPLILESHQLLPCLFRFLGIYAFQYRHLIRTLARRMQQIIAQLIQHMNCAAVDIYRNITAQRRKCMYHNVSPYRSK